MQYVPLGRTGLKVSRLCLGCMSYGQGPDTESRHSGWTLDEEASRPFIKDALEAGINFFDTSNIYAIGQSEEILGNALKDFSTREEVVIATKVFGPMTKGQNALGLSRKAIMANIDASLRRLKTDYIDLYQAHAYDVNTPIEETLEAFHDVVKSGKARYIGFCNSYAWQLSKAFYTAKANNWTAPVSIQSQYNLVYREDEREIHVMARDQGLAILPWSPIARGFLAGNRKRDGSAVTARGESDPWRDQLYGRASDFDIAERLAELAAERGESPAKLALAWMLAKPYITSAIIGATKPHHLADAVGALDVVLSAEEAKILEDLYQPRAPWILNA